MKRLMILAMSTLIGATTGCKITSPPMEDRGRTNAWLMQSIRDTSVDRAVIEQHTLFPYHFISNGAMLNELGKRDLEVLAAHYGEHSGRLNIRQGNIAADLYEARVATVVDALAVEGVERESITIADALPGGDGMASEHVVTILEDETAPASLSPSGSTTGGGQTGASR